MSKMRTGQQWRVPRSPRRAKLAVQGIIVRQHGGHFLAPLAVEVDGVFGSKIARRRVPIDGYHLGDELVHFLGEHLTLTGQLVGRGSSLRLRVYRYGLVKAVDGRTRTQPRGRPLTLV